MFGQVAPWKDSRASSRTLPPLTTTKESQRKKTLLLDWKMAKFPQPLAVPREAGWGAAENTQDYL